MWSDPADGGLRLRWRGRTFDLRREIVRHRDDEGAIRFAVGGVCLRYRRRGPSTSQMTWDEIDFTADEPWTWEDSDFGLFVFHLATRTGPLKYRHRFADPPPGEVSGHGGIEVDQDGLTRRLPGMREERVRWGELVEVRAKFEVSGIYASPTLLTFEAGEELAVVPVGFRAGFVRELLLPHLRRLEGWDDGPLEVALAYAERDGTGPRGEETRDDWAERPIWARPGG